MRYSEVDDYRSATLLNLIIVKDYEELLPPIIKGKIVAIVGAGPSLSKVKEIDAEVVISADGATNYLVEIGITPDIVVTDLDGISTYPPSIYVVHAHGDNYSLLWKVKHMRKVIGTCQVRPFGKLHLYGGFTDGDRAYVIARKFGANSIKFFGWDLESDLTGKYSKPYLLSDTLNTKQKSIKLRVASTILSVF
ncbi:hypothetical protein HS7_16400 [Sulfolobales archaeon HS-7]|nr:hypothetical protein HS7_16400 [Sulfolobales archaeon HS-7]